MLPDEYVAALRRERAHYETRGDAARVAEVTAELIRLGVEQAHKVERAVRRPAETRRGR